MHTVKYDCIFWSWVQSSCSCTRLSLGHALPASQLWQQLRGFHHPNVTKRPLQPRLGSCLDTGEPAEQTRVSACTCQYKCLLRLLAICGTAKSTAQRAKDKQISCMAWEVIQLWSSQKNRFCNVLLLKPTSGRNYLEEGNHTHLRKLCKEWTRADLTCYWVIWQIRTLTDSSLKYRLRISYKSINLEKLLRF